MRDEHFVGLLKQWSKELLNKTHFGTSRQATTKELYQAIIKQVASFDDTIELLKIEEK